MKKSRYTRYFKYPLDCLIAAFLILLTSPVLLSTILLLAIANRGSGIFFLQERPGKNGKIFRIIKFKTMNDRKDCRGNFLPDSLRMTPIGKIVRATSVDELPQLFNVLKGDMALIGPRPLLVQYLPLYNEEQARRHESAPRHHWMGTSKWKKRNQLEKEIRTGYLVRRPCLLHDRHDDILQNTQMRYQPQRHIPKGRGNHETI